MEPIRNEPVLRKRRSGLGRFFTTLFIVFLLLFAGYFYWKYFFTYSSGERYGQLQKFSYKGSLFKTYEGEMILSSVRGNNNVALASEKFFFSVDKKNVAQQMMGLQGKYVNVFYKQKNGALLWRGESSYIVDSIIRVDQ